MSTCKARQLIKPWITKGLLKSIKIKNRLFYSGDKIRYKVYKNKISSLVKSLIIITILRPICII